MPSKILGDRLREARKAINCRQEDLAKVTGIKQSQISRYESGIQMPNKPNLAKLALALNLDAESIVSNAKLKAGFFKYVRLAAEHAADEICRKNGTEFSPKRMEEFINKIEHEFKFSLGSIVETEKDKMSR